MGALDSGEALGIPVYALRAVPLRLLAIFSVSFALLISLRVLAPLSLIGLIIDLYSVFLALVLIYLAFRSHRYPARVLLSPDVSAMIIASIYSLLFGGYIPIMIYLFVILVVVSSLYVEDLLGHIILAPRIQARQGVVRGGPGARVKLYPGIILGDDSVISKGSVVVREPFTSDLRSFRDAGDLVIGLSSIESGSSEAVIVSRGSLIANSYREALLASLKISALFSLAMYLVSIPTMILAPGLSIAAVSVIAPSTPYVISLYIFKRASDLARSGVVSWSPMKTSRAICRASENYVEAEVALYTEAQGETVIRPRESLRQEDLLRIACAADNIEGIRGLCKNIGGYLEEYRVVMREGDIAVLEDRRTRLKICVAVPREAELHGFVGDISPIDPKATCRGKLYVVSTRYEVLGYICSGRSISVSNLLTISRISRLRKTSLLLDIESLRILESSGEEIRKILGPIDLMVRGKDLREWCPQGSREVLLISRGPRSDSCENTIYVVDPSIAANKYGEIKTSLARGAAIVMRRDLAWIERIFSLCSRWKKDLAFIAIAYLLLRGAGSIISISSGVLWAQYIFEIVCLITSIFRIYST